MAIQRFNWQLVLQRIHKSLTICNRANWFWIEENRINGYGFARLPAYSLHSKSDVFLERSCDICTTKSLFGGLTYPLDRLWRGRAFHSRIIDSVKLRFELRLQYWKKLRMKYRGETVLQSLSENCRLKDSISRKPMVFRLRFEFVDVRLRPVRRDV